MATTPKKPPAPKAATRDGDLPGPPLSPVTPKIGETAGNLQARARAFARRRVKSG